MQTAMLQASDLLKLRSVAAVRFSPDGSRIAYTVTRSDGPAQKFEQIQVMTIADGQSIALSDGEDPSGNPAWSPDGKWIAYQGASAGKQGLFIVHPDGAGRRFLTPLVQANGPLRSTGGTVAWSPDGRRIAYVSGQPGPEPPVSGVDPIVIQSYFYKAGDQDVTSRFNNNNRLHIFVIDIESGKSRQLTQGVDQEHSIDWSPNREEIAFIRNPDPEDDQFVNYELCAVRVETGEVRVLLQSENAAYRPHYSPDGRTIAFEATKRGLNGLEFARENAHVWLMDPDGGRAREVTASIDNRLHAPGWSPDGRSILTMVDDSGNVRLYRQPVQGGDPEPVVMDTGAVAAWSAHGDRVAYSLSTPTGMAELYVKAGHGPAKQLTNLNREILSGKTIAHTEPITFISNDGKWPVQGLLTYPADFDPGRKYPLITVIHGGPHDQQTISFNIKNQVYAARGYATLMVNYRGSTGYGQAFTDAIFREQNGDEAQDILFGIGAAMRRHKWVDEGRLGIEGVSYGGQLAAWLVTQTHIFRAAVLTAAVINIPSFSYTTNYRPYEQMQWGLRPHQDNLLDVLWERSPLRHAFKVRTPTMLVHGENDNDVPVSESEQFYMALKEARTDTLMVRYANEGHSIRGPRHVVDWIERSLGWYGKYF